MDVLGEVAAGIMQFDWISYEDIKSLRTHETKHFPHPNEVGKMVCIQSLGRLHAYTDNGFEDIATELPNYKFPEGVLATAGETKEILDLPAWGDIRVEDKGKTVRVYDRAGVPIYRYHQLISVPEGVKPFIVLDSEGVQTKTSETKESDINYQNGERVERTPEAEELTFDVTDGKLFVVFPKDAKNTGTVQLYDDTDTTSTNNKDTNIRQEGATNNYGTDTFLTFGRYDPGQTHNALLNFTLASGTGTVTGVSINLYRLDALGWSSNANSATFDAHEITQTAWTETGATWNKYDGTNNWSSAGGDFSATIIDTAGAATNLTWLTLILMGTGSTNPLTLTWSNAINILIREATGSNSRALGTPSREYITDTTKRPYVEITYTAGGGDTSSFFPFLDRR